ncbi:MAG: hypothetical protein J6Y32_03875 [Bacteroidales bacterium]|nr:hypothetical protein [Bacteroidales bacterium]
MKNGTSFFLGVIVGAVACFGVLYLIGKRQSPAEDINKNIVMFQKPKGVLEYKDDNWRTGVKTYTYSEFKVFQVLANGAALASGRQNDTDIFIGITVLLLPLKNGCYYDGQIVSAPKGYCARQAGIYRYTSKGGSENTVPVVRFYPKK